MSRGRKLALVAVIAVLWFALRTCQHSSASVCSRHWRIREPSDTGLWPEHATARGIQSASISGVQGVDLQYNFVYVTVSNEAWNRPIAEKCQLVADIEDAALRENGNVAIPIIIRLTGRSRPVAVSHHDDLRGDYFEVVG